jgi:hypothetical protein
LLLHNSIIAADGHAGPKLGEKQWCDAIAAGLNLAKEVLALS